MLAGPGNAGKSSDMELPSGAMTVPVSRVVNELKCDYLDFAWSDFARARRLAVGRVSGSIVLAIVRDMSRNGTGVAVADRPVRVDRDYVRGAGTVQNALTIPVSFDPKLALDPGSAGLDCSPDARLAQPIVGVAALAAELTRIESAGGAAFGAAGGVTGGIDPRVGNAPQMRVELQAPVLHRHLAGGQVERLEVRTAPGGMNVRVDSGLYTGYKVPPYYDSMIAKLIVYGTTRERCILRLRRALEEFVVDGVKTTIPLHQALLDDPEFQRGDYTIKWLEEWLARQG